MQQQEAITKPIQQNPNQEQHYTLDADIATGWKPKMKIIGPMPLNFDNPYLDKLIKPLIFSETTPHQVIYLGLRPKDTFEMHSFLAKNYRYKYRHMLSSDYSHLKPFFKKFYSQFQPLCKMPFHGMNPRSKSNIIFQSRFESGNLDCVVRTRTNQYDLFLRIDSNTKGHIMWYYFKVSNSSDKPKTIRLNLCNLRRNHLIYEKCLQPYIHRAQTGWKQQANNVTITQQSVRFYKQHMIFSHLEPQQPLKFRKMSFDVELAAFEQIQVAYSVPYTYSQLLKDIKDLKIQASKNRDIKFDINMSNLSLSGLEIPYIKIYKEDEQENSKKKEILVIGRQHPGEANGSHVLKGFMQQLISSKQVVVNNLLNYFNFHFIPMLNPDGVVMGNFRTSLYGKDLNRLFRKGQTLLFPEVQLCKDLVFQITKRKRKKMFMFLDFHGHSMLKNTFCFAPGCFETNGPEDIRQFPKLISEITEMFRFQSCSFRISTNKKTTARAVFCGDANLCYTIETSNWSYCTRIQRENVLFDKFLWHKLGVKIMLSLGIFFENILQRRAEKKRRILSKNESTQMVRMKNTQRVTLKTEQNTEKKNKITFSIKRKQHTKVSNTEKVIPSPHRLKNRAISEVQLPKMKTEEFAEQRYRNELEEGEEQENLEEIEEDSDESDEQDMEKQKFKRYVNVAAQMLIQFEKAYYGDDYQARARYEFPKKSPKKREIPMMKQACLRSSSKNEKKTIESDKNITKIRFNEQKKFQRNKINLNESPLKKDRLKSTTKMNFMENIHKQDIAKSLPKITIVNYTPFEEISEKKGLKIPHIDSINVKRLTKYLE